MATKKLAGSTVDEIKAAMAELFNMGKNPIALVNDVEVDGSYQMKATDKLEFKKREGKIQIIHGANNDHRPMAGMTVGEIRKSMAHEFNIPDAADAILNGKVVGEDQRPKENDTLEFHIRRKRTRRR